MPEPLIIADPALHTPPDREFWTTPEMLNEHGRPKFGVSEVAKCFFGRSPFWARRLLQQRWEDPEGNLFEVPRSASGDRWFRLYDIERWAHILAHHTVLDGRQLELVVFMVKTNAQLHGFIT